MPVCIRVEKHLIKNNSVLDNLSFGSKNLYNQANYLVRNKFFETSKQKKEGLIKNAIYLDYNEMNKLIKELDNLNDYKNIPEQTKQSLLRLLDKNWKSFFRSIKDWSKNKGKYKGQPKPPKYLDKQGRNILVYPGQNIGIKDGKFKIPKTKIEIKTQVSKKSLKEVRVIPQGNKNFMIEIIYSKEIQNLSLNKSNTIGIDIGLNNLMAITSNQKENNLCFLVNGKPLKFVNQFYNKQKSISQSQLKIIQDKLWSHKLDRLNLKRKFKIEDYMHKASRIVIDFCKEFDIGKIVIGHNKNWKQEISIGKRNNQNFVQVPFNKLIQMIEYKAEEIGIEVLITEESYTSKIDHLALEEMKHQETYLGKRIKRGLFRSSTGIELNADLNGVLGILRKVNEVSKDFLKSLGNRGCVLQPIKLNC
jgi:putative transposase